MKFDFINPHNQVTCEICLEGTNLGVTYRCKELTICYACLSDIYRAIQKQADYLEFKSEQFENINKNKRTNTYFL